MRAHGRSLPAAALAILVTAGCGSTHSALTTQPATQSSLIYQPSAAKLPSCAHAGRAIPFPRTFPKDFPVPPGTSITGHRVPIGGGIAATGFVPSQGFSSTVHFFPREIQKLGFKLLHLEIDSPHDSEGSYSGHGYVGGWALRAMPACKGAMAIQISALRQKRAK